METHGSALLHALLSHLQQDVNFITQLFGKLLDEDTSDREMTELVRVYTFCI